MTKQDHQLDEMVNAIQQVTSVAKRIGYVEAQQEIINLVNLRINEGFSYQQMFDEVMEWAGK